MTCSSSICTSSKIVTGNSARRIWLPWRDCSGWRRPKYMKWRLFIITSRSQKRVGTVPCRLRSADRTCLRRIELRNGGAKELLKRLPELLGREVRVLSAPCVGRCEQAPVAVVHRKPIPGATPDAVRDAVVSVRLKTRRALISISTGTERKAATAPCAIASSIGAMSRASSRPWKTRDCAALAAQVFRPAENGASCAVKRRRG